MALTRNGSTADAGEVLMAGEIEVRPASISLGRAGGR
jgi:hypothetical protein